MICQCTIDPGAAATHCQVRDCEVTGQLIRKCKTGEFALPPAGPNECRRRGDQLRLQQCVTCKGNVQIKVFGCELHGECALEQAPAGVASCRSCTDKQPAEPCYPLRTTPIEGLAPDPIQINCSVIDFGGRRLLAWRKRWTRSQVWISELDDNHQAISNQRIEIPHTQANAGGCEDPRLFVFGGALHVEYIGWSGKVASVCVAVLADDFEVVKNFNPNYRNRQTWEKNWGFFEHAGDLHAVYSIQPHLVLRFTGEPVSREMKAPARIPWSHGLLRGGASPVLHDGVWWSFFHGTVDASHGRTYSVGCYTFENRPPFRPLRATPRPIMVPDPIDRPGASTPYVVFPCGAVFDSGRWLVSYGYYDKTCRMAEFDHQQLQRAMVAV